MNPPLKLGWREWCALSELGIPAIKVKVDTGARTSALHTCSMEPFYKKNRLFVRFQVHPLQKQIKPLLKCVAEVKDRRFVSDSGGHKEMRYIIETPIQIGHKSWPIEISLTNRDTMCFRMLLGRNAMQNEITIDPVASYLQGRLKAKRLYFPEKPK